MVRESVGFGPVADFSLDVEALLAQAHLVSFDQFRTLGRFRAVGGNALVAFGLREGWAGEWVGG